MVKLLSRGGSKAAIAIKQRIKGKHNQELPLFVALFIQFITAYFALRHCFAKA